MSCQKGNAARSRPQKYKNHTAFKNDLHDKTQQTKQINSMEVAGVCERCKKIIEWKIKYKKYKPLKAPGKCTKCDERNVKHAYHMMCQSCARQCEVCPKCGEKNAVIEYSKVSKEESNKLDNELKAVLKELPERKRRTFLRYLSRKDSKVDETKKNENKSKEDLINKIKEFAVREESDSEYDSDSDLDCLT